jgi:protein TonB
MRQLLSLIIIFFLAEIAVATTTGQDQVYRSAEQMPRFPGGEAALMKYIKSHLQTPQTQEQINGNVILQFVVHSDGSIGEVKVVRSLHPDYDKEAIRVIKSLPKFTPGRQNGQAVAVWYTLPVIFR